MVWNTRRSRSAALPIIEDGVSPSSSVPQASSTAATSPEEEVKEAMFKSVENKDVVMQDGDLEEGEAREEIAGADESFERGYGVDQRASEVLDKTPWQQERLSPGAFGFGNDSDSMKMFFEALAAAEKHEIEQKRKYELQQEGMSTSSFGGGPIATVGGQFRHVGQEQMDIQMEDGEGVNYVKHGYIKDTDRLEREYLDAWAGREELLNAIESGKVTRSMIETGPIQLQLIASEIQERMEVIKKLETDAVNLMMPDKRVQAWLCQLSITYRPYLIVSKLILERKQEQNAIIEQLEACAEKLEEGIEDIGEIGTNVLDTSVLRNGSTNLDDTDDEELAHAIAASLAEMPQDSSQQTRHTLSKRTSAGIKPNISKLERISEEPEGTRTVSGEPDQQPIYGPDGAPHSRASPAKWQDERYLCQCDSEITRHIRSSPPVLPAYHTLISDSFVKDKIHFVELQYSPELMSRVTSVMKVNKVEKAWPRAKVSHNVERVWRTVIYYQHPETSEWSYSNHPSRDVLFIPFNPYGYGSYQVYKCNDLKCGNTYQVGYFQKSLVRKHLFHHGKNWFTSRESFGCSHLDTYFGIISKAQQEYEAIEKTSRESWNNWRDDSDDGDGTLNGTHQWRAPVFPYYLGEVPEGIDKLWQRNESYSPDGRTARLRKTFREEYCCHLSANERLLGRF